MGIDVKWWEGRYRDWQQERKLRNWRRDGESGKLL